MKSAASTEIAAQGFLLHERVTWMQQHSGGYGYVTQIPGVVVGFTSQKVRVAVQRIAGQTQIVTVDAKNLRRSV